jgi:hypothetical protein
MWIDASFLRQPPRTGYQQSRAEWEPCRTAVARVRIAQRPARSRSRGRTGRTQASPDMRNRKQQFHGERHMPSVSNATLNLTTINNDVTIDVAFDVTFTPFERNLADMGMTFDRHIEVEGVDGANSTVVANFPNIGLAVTAGAGSQVIPVATSITVPRSQLQEDPNAGDNDEIRCKIRIHSQGFPPVFTNDFLTNQRVLVG